MSDIDDLCQIIHRGIGLNFEDLAEEIIAAGFHRDCTATDIADAILAAGWRPPARVTTTAAELDNLPGGSVVIDSDGSAWRKGSDYRDIPRWWLAGAPGGGVGSSIVINHAPVTVVYTPEES